MDSSHGPKQQAPEPAPIPDAERGIFSDVFGTQRSRPVGPDGEQAVTFRLSGWAVIRYTLLAALVLNGLSLLGQLHEVFLLLLLAVILATAIEPLVQWLRRGPFTRGQGILLIYSFLFAAILLLAFVFIPRLLEQSRQFTDSLPERLSTLRTHVEQIGEPAIRSALLSALGELQGLAQSGSLQPAAPADPQQLLAAGGKFAHLLFSIISVFLLAFYWLTERATIKRAVLRLVGPNRARQVNESWLDVEDKLGGWVRGQLLVMLALGIMAGVVFALLGLPNPVLLAVLAGLCEIIPLVGPFLAFLPAILVALTIDPTKALLLIPIAIVIQQIEGNVLIPRIMSHSVGVSPLTVIVGIMVGSILYGPVGAFLAVPIAAATQVILGELHPALDEQPAAETRSTGPGPKLPSAPLASAAPPQVR